SAGAPAATPRPGPLAAGEGAVPPADPHASLTPGAIDLIVNAGGSVSVVVQTTNVPVTATVKVHLIPQFGAAVRVAATPTAGDASSSTWTAQLTPPDGPFTVQADVGP